MSSSATMCASYYQSYTMVVLHTSADASKVWKYVCIHSVHDADMP